MQTSMTTTPQPGRLRQFATAVTAMFRPSAQAKALSPVSDRGWVRIFDWKPGAWQQDLAPVSSEKMLSHWAVYACVSLIAEDLGKLRLRLVERGDDGVWREAKSAAFGPVLRRPNRYQTRQQFISAWVISRLLFGNSYVLKQRDNRGVVTGLYVLDPMRVMPLIAPNGSVFYQLGQDDLATVNRDIPAVPASEIIHDRGACLFHPLLGVSPLFACGLAATQGIRIQENATSFFKNRSMPGGLLIAPGPISDETAERLKTVWDEKFSGDNTGKTAVLGDNLRWESMSVNAVDSQLIEQLKLTANMVCSAFHVPPFKIGLENLPAGQKVEDMNRVYYADCLQAVIESIEAVLDEGLGLTETGRPLGVEFDLDDLLRMDSSTLVSVIGDAVKAGIMSPNEARLRLNLPPVDGGAAPYLQMQNFSLEALSRRDAMANPFAANGTVPPAPPAPGAEEIEADARKRLELVHKEAEAQITKERSEAEARVRAAADREASALLERMRVGLGG